MSHGFKYWLSWKHGDETEWEEVGGSGVTVPAIRKMCAKLLTAPKEHEDYWEGVEKISIWFQSSQSDAKRVNLGDGKTIYVKSMGSVKRALPPESAAPAFLARDQETNLAIAEFLSSGKSGRILPTKKKAKA